MDTSPHIGGAADSQKDRGVRQRKSLVFLFVIPDSSDMQQNESVTARRNAHYRRKTCPPALRRNRSSMSVFFGTFLKYQVCQAGILPLQVFTTGGARRTSSAVETSRYCALTCRYLDKTPTNNRSRDSHSAASTQQCNRLSGARCSMVRLQVLTFQRRGHCCWCESPRKIDECR